MRLFFACTFTASSLDRLTSLQAAICPDPSPDRLKGGRLTKKDRLHLTLHFLGNTSTKTLPQLKDCLRQLDLAQPPFLLRPQALSFLGESPKKIACLTFKEGPQLVRLASLNEELISCLRRQNLVGPEASRPFWPHVTLARGLSTPENNIALNPKQQEGLQMSRLLLLESRPAKKEGLSPSYHIQASRSL